MIQRTEKITGEVTVNEPLDLAGWERVTASLRPLIFKVEKTSNEEKWEYEILLRNGNVIKKILVTLHETW